jgi:hypothetical protein
MPRRELRAPTERRGETKGLVNELAEELRHPREIGQPLILEDHLFGEDALRVQVVWDRWEDVSDDLRSEVIYDAYSTALGEEYRQRIRLALGVTVPEAANLGLLPFQVTPARKKGEEPSHEEYRKAMIDAGASLLFSEARPQLRFAAIEDAEAAMEHLQEKLPKSRWIIAQEVSSLSGE